MSDFRPAEMPTTFDDTTSPSQLQEVTLDPEGTFNASGGFQSLNGPMRGRSIKEFEESLTGLRKENFNLKLRIYFLEERMGTNFCLDKENAVKKNIELKVEVESLKKELTEKQDLLCQAVRAMELDEEEHKKISDDQQKKISCLQNQLDSLQEKFEARNNEGRCQGDHVMYEQDKDYYDPGFHFPKQCDHENYILELESKIKEVEGELEKSRENTRELENLLQLTDNRNSNLTMLEEELKEKDNTIKKLQADVEERNKAISNYRVRLGNLEADLIDKKNAFDFVAKDLKERTLHLQELKYDNEKIQKLLNDAQQNISVERRKNEKHKLSIQDRNKRIVELEDDVAQMTKKLSIVQAQFESAVKTEVQRKHHDGTAHSVREPSKGDVGRVLHPRPASLPQLTAAACPPPSSSADALDPSLDQQQQQQQRNPSGGGGGGDLDHLRRHAAKLERDYLKACKIIQMLAAARNKEADEIEELKTRVARKDAEIDRLSLSSQRVSGGYASDVSMTGRVAALPPPASGWKGPTRASSPAVSARAAPNNDETTADLVEDPKLLIQQYKELTDSLEEQKKVLICTLEETKNQLQELESKCESLKTELKTRENRIVDLEFELLSISQGVSGESMGMGEKSDVGNEKPASFFIKEIEEKDREIEKLESELKKRTCDLQAIVNKELWEKNREIERLTKRYNEIIASKDQELSRIENTLSTKNQQLELLTNRISELGIIVRHCDDTIEVIHKENQEIVTLEKKLNDSVNERDFYRSQLIEFDDKLKLAAEKHSSYLERIEKLEQALKQAKSEAEQCEVLRQDALEVCSMLSRRLEDLAYFLDSLLKQKSVLGFLGSKKNNRLKQLVNQSLDISRTLSLSMTLNPNQSLMQLSNLSALLNNSALEDNEIIQGSEDKAVNIDASLFYQSHFIQTEHVSEDTGVIAVLRGQIENLQKQIEARDIELEKIRNDDKLATDKIKHLSVVKLDELSKDDENIMDVLMAIAPETEGAQVPKSQQQIYDTLVCTKVLVSGDKERYELDGNSESESWSEPDRVVSKARIGLGDCPTPKCSKEDLGSTEENAEKNSSGQKIGSRKSILAENRQTIINLHEQICQMETKLKSKEAAMEALERVISEVNLQLDTERQISREVQRQEYQKLEAVIKERNELLEKISKAEEKVETAEIVKQETQTQLSDLQKTINDVKISQKNLQDSVDLKNKDAQNKMNELELEKGILQEKLKISEQNAVQIRADCATAEQNLKLLKEEIRFMEQNIREEMQMEWEHKFNAQDQNYEIKIRLLEHTAETELKLLRDEADAKVQKISEEANVKIKQLMDENQDLLHRYETECVKRAEVDKVMGTIKELEKFKKVVKVAEERICSLEESEQRLKRQLKETETEYQSKMDLLHEELEKINLLYSESVLEKSHILNDKSELEFQLKQFAEKETEFGRQVAEYKGDFANMKDTFQKQLAHLENQKSRLELRIGELEQANAELKNRIVKLQAAAAETVAIQKQQQHQQQQQQQLPVGSSPSSRILDLFLNKTVPAGYKRQQSDYSEYSDDPSSCAARAPYNLSLPAAELDRQNANSSPDLGIESDHGRFSSLEASVNTSRPFLRTLELTESMSNLLNKDDAQTATCNNELCCTKTKELVNENNNLRKRLMHTRRLLDDTLSELTVANKRKKEVEKTICKQIRTTSQVLREAKVNLDKGSDREAMK